MVYITTKKNIATLPKCAFVSYMRSFRNSFQRNINPFHDINLAGTSIIYLTLNISVNLELMKNLWIPNIFIYNLKSFKTIDVLSKLAGLWIDSNKRIYYSQATHITFICPMVFDAFPLDTQICKFQVKCLLNEIQPTEQAENTTLKF